MHDLKQIKRCVELVNGVTVMTIIIMVISIALYLSDKGEHTALYKIVSNVYIRTSKILNYIAIII